MTPDRCTHHEELVVTTVKVGKDVEAIRSDISELKVVLNASIKKWDKHVEESVERIREMDKNTSFRKSASKAMWVIYGTLIGLLAKLFFWR